MSAIHSHLATVWFIVASVLVTWVRRVWTFQLIDARMRLTVLAVLTPWKGEQSTGRCGCPTNCEPISFANADERYGEVDYIYGQKAYENHNGFTNAQSALNVVEVLLQIWFLRLRAQPPQEGKALLVGYSVSLVTLSKTVLYWLQEYFSGYINIIAI
jgi:hypothetical protein